MALDPVVLAVGLVVALVVVVAVGLVVALVVVLVPDPPDAVGEVPKTMAPSDCTWTVVVPLSPVVDEVELDPVGGLEAGNPGSEL